MFGPNTHQDELLFHMKKSLFVILLSVVIAPGIARGEKQLSDADHHMHIRPENVSATWEASDLVVTGHWGLIR